MIAVALVCFFNELDSYLRIRGNSGEGLSSTPVNGDLAGALAAVFLTFVLYITIRVIISLRQEKNLELSKSKQIIDLTKRHLSFKKK
jgi:hypothetical protein